MMTVEPSVMLFNPLMTEHGLFSTPDESPLIEPPRPVLGTPLERRKEHQRAVRRAERELRVRRAEAVLREELQQHMLAKTGRALKLPARGGPGVPAPLKLVSTQTPGHTHRSKAALKRLPLDGRVARSPGLVARHGMGGAGSDIFRSQPSLGDSHSLARGGGAAGAAALRRRKRGGRTRGHEEARTPHMRPSLSLPAFHPKLGASPYTVTPQSSLVRSLEEREAGAAVAFHGKAPRNMARKGAEAMDHSRAQRRRRRAHKARRVLPEDRQRVSRVHRPRPTSSPPSRRRPAAAARSASRRRPQSSSGRRSRSPTRRGRRRMSPGRVSDAHAGRGMSYTDPAHHMRVMHTPAHPVSPMPAQAAPRAQGELFGADAPSYHHAYLRGFTNSPHGHTSSIEVHTAAEVTASELQDADQGTPGLAADAIAVLDDQLLPLATIVGAQPASRGAADTETAGDPVVGALSLLDIDDQWEEDLDLDADLDRSSEHSSHKPQPTEGKACAPEQHHHDSSEGRGAGDCERGSGSDANAKPQHRHLSCSMSMERGDKLFAVTATCHPATGAATITALQVASCWHGGLRLTRAEVESLLPGSLPVSNLTPELWRMAAHDLIAPSGRLDVVVGADTPQLVLKPLSAPSSPTHTAALAGGRAVVHALPGVLEASHVVELGDELYIVNARYHTDTLSATLSVLQPTTCASGGFVMSPADIARLLVLVDEIRREDTAAAARPTVDWPAHASQLLDGVDASTWAEAVVYISCLVNIRKRGATLAVVLPWDEMVEPRPHVEEAALRSLIATLLSRRQEQASGREAAAVRLQAGARGMLDRRRVREIRRSVLARRNVAATKLQAQARGMRDRRRVHRLKRDTVSSDDREREAAAVRLQARARGMRDRRRVHRLKRDTVASDDREREAAAVRLQARARGMRDRRRVNQLRRG